MALVDIIFVILMITLAIIAAETMNGIYLIMLDILLVFIVMTFLILRLQRVMAANANIQETLR